MEDTEELPTVTREFATRHMCRCVIVWPALGSDEPQTEPCTTWVSNPDQPFCPACESRHPETRPPIQITAIAPQGGIS